MTPLYNRKPDFLAEPAALEFLKLMIHFLIICELVNEDNFMKYFDCCDSMLVHSERL